MEGATGTDVNKALTSKEVMTSPGCSLFPCNCWMKCCVFIRWWGTSLLGVDDVYQFFGHPIGCGTSTGHYGPERGAYFMNFGKAIDFGGTALVGYNCLYLVLLRPPVCLMSLSIAVNLFLRLLVGSFLSTLYLLVSCNRVLALLM